MKKNTVVKILLDTAILLISLLLCIAVWYMELPQNVSLVILTPAALLCILAVVDVVKQISRKHEKRQPEHKDRPMVHELVLLDEQDRPVKSWNLAGKTSLIIGRGNQDEDIDIDLADCEYGALVDSQHAVLNYSLDRWYLEDLDSHNGVKIKKVEDGICYQVMLSRPCRVMAGDIIYIANTRLLLT